MELVWEIDDESDRSIWFVFVIDTEALIEEDIFLATANNRLVVAEFPIDEATVRVRSANWLTAAEFTTEDESERVFCTALSIETDDPIDEDTLLVKPMMRLVVSAWLTDEAIDRATPPNRLAATVFEIEEVTTRV